MLSPIEYETGTLRQHVRGLAATRLASTNKIKDNQQADPEAA
jgi:hypothetical protein